MNHHRKHPKVPKKSKKRSVSGGRKRKRSVKRGGDILSSKLADLDELIVRAKEDAVKLAKNLVTAKGYADIRKAFSDQPPYVAIDMLVEFVKKNELTAPHLQKYMKKHN